MSLVKKLAIGAVVVVLGCAGFCVFGVVRIGQSAKTNAGATAQRTPGKAEFDAANGLITSHKGRVAFGNTAEAEAVAAEFSSTLKGLREVFFEGGKKGGVSLTHGQFLTYCELRGDRCAILVHVPELRRFEDEAKKSLGELAWLAAQQTLRARGIEREMKLAVGLRGAILYGPIVTGRYISDEDAEENGEEFSGEGTGELDRLYPFFAPAATQPAPGSQPAELGIEAAA